MYENKSGPDQLAEILIAKKAKAEKHADVQPEAFNEKNAARYIAMSISFLRQARSHGNRLGRTPAPPFVRIGRTIRYRRKDLDAWLEHLLVEMPGVDGQGGVVPSDEGEAA